MAYYVNRNIKMTWWEKIYIPEIIKGMIITSRHFFMNLFGFIPFFLGTQKERKIMTVYYPEEQVEYPVAYRGRPVLRSLLQDRGVGHDNLGQRRLPLAVVRCGA